MRTFAVITISCILLIQTCTVNRAHENSLFKKEVLPVMIKNCSPCHFPGGKMYERMPFDQDTTIINHGQRILGRIKNEEESILLKKFLTQNENGLSADKPH